MSERKKVVIVEGIVGAGKSSLSRQLGKALGSNTLITEEPDEANQGNLYLADFYANMPRWAFTMQVHLLQKRYRAHLQAQWHAMNGYGHAVLDRSLPGDTCFAKLQLQTGTLTQREYDTYCELYQSMTASVLFPNVAIWLLVEPEVARERVLRRMETQTGRRCEEDAVDLDYLRGLEAEIGHMMAVLQKQGVMVLEVPWDTDRETVEQRALAAQSLASRIEAYEPQELLLDLHRRTI
jgi:deoxyadenosine/deoxycytidine kinase